MDARIFSAGVILTFGAAQTIPAKVAAVEPITIVQGAAAIASIASAISGSASDKKMRGKLQEISTKLDFVIQRQETILSEIIGLKIYFKEELRTSFSREAGIDFISVKDRLDVALAAPSRAKERTSLQQMHGEAERVAFRMKEYGPAGYQTAFSAASVLAIVNYRIELPKPQRRQAMQQISVKFNEWLLPTGVESVPKVREDAASERTRMEAQVAAYPRTHTWEIGYTMRGRCYYHTKRTVTITGDLPTGFEGTARDFEVRGTCEPGDCRRCFRITDINAALEPYLALQRIGTSRSLNLRIESSGLPPLDHIRMLRSSWQDQNDRVATLDAMILSITTAKQTLDRWGAI